jgi:hypothetical protein
LAEQHPVALKMPPSYHKLVKLLGVGVDRVTKMITGD